MMPEGSHDHPKGVFWDVGRARLILETRIHDTGFDPLVLSALDPSKSGLMNKHIVKHTPKF